MLNRVEIRSYKEVQEELHKLKVSPIVVDGTAMDIHNQFIDEILQNIVGTIWIPSSIGDSLVTEGPDMILRLIATNHD